MDIIMVGLWVLSSQNGLGHGGERMRQSKQAPKKAVRAAGQTTAGMYWQYL